MLERFVGQTSFVSQEDFKKNFKVNVPENFNFGYDVVDAWAEEEPEKKALCWTNDKGEHIDFTFAEMKKYTDQTAAYFQSLGIGRGDMVMLILKRRYEFWFSIIALHKLGAVVIPATHLLTKNGKMCQPLYVLYMLIVMMIFHCCILLQEQQEILRWLRTILLTRLVILQRVVIGIICIVTVCI